MLFRLKYEVLVICQQLVFIYLRVKTCMSLGSLPIMHYSRGIPTNMTEVLFLYIAAVKHQKTPYEHRMVRFVYKSCVF
jgi:hypothetical protein